MIKSGQVIDSTTSRGIPYASIEVTDMFGTYLGAGAAAGVDGIFTIDSTMMKPGTFLRISSVGFNTQSFPYTEYYPAKTFAISPQVSSLPDVIVTATKKANENKGLIIGAAAALVLWYLFVKKK